MLDTVRRNPVTGRETGAAALQLTVRWLWVGVPLAWGILESLRASLAFFR
jgi:hypothetical protein